MQAVVIEIMNKQGIVMAMALGLNYVRASKEDHDMENSTVIYCLCVNFIFRSGRDQSYPREPTGGSRGQSSDPNHLYGISEDLEGHTWGALNPNPRRHHQPGPCPHPGPLGAQSAQQTGLPAGLHPCHRPMAVPQLQWGGILVRLCPDLLPSPVGHRKAVPGFLRPVPALLGRVRRHSWALLNDLAGHEDEDEEHEDGCPGSLLPLPGSSGGGKGGASGARGGF